LNLKKYDDGKNPFEWQRESAEMGTILESLFTSGDSKNEEIIYRLTKRIAVLLSNIFPNIEKDIKELYKQRSSFVHGDFFNHIAKERKHSFNDIPLPDFGLLASQREYVRWALVIYLYLAKIIKENKEEYKSIERVMDLLEVCIIDITLREKMQNDIKLIIDLLPHRS
jgi:uncharacterized protein YktB (UPF0637 family)